MNKAFVNRALHAGGLVGSQAHGTKHVNDKVIEPCGVFQLLSRNRHLQTAVG